MPRTNGSGYADSRFYLCEMRQGAGSSPVIDHVADLDRTAWTDYWFANQAAALVPTGTQCERCGGTEFEKERHWTWFESGVSFATVLKPRHWYPADLYHQGRTSIEAGSTARYWRGSSPIIARAL